MTTQTTHTKSIEERIGEKIQKLRNLKIEQSFNPLDELFGSTKQAMRELVEEVLGELKTEIKTTEVKYANKASCEKTDEGIYVYDGIVNGLSMSKSLIQSKLTQLKGGEEHEY